MDIEKEKSKSDAQRASDLGITLEDLEKDRNEYIEECKKKIKFLLGCIEVYQSRFGETRLTSWTSAFIEVHTEMCVQIAQASHDDIKDQSLLLDDMEQIAHDLMKTSFKEHKEELWSAK